MKFKISIASLVIAAGSLEEALGAMSTHFATASRQVANERDLADCKPVFTIEEVKDDAEAHDIQADHATEKHGVVALDLDPESYAGIEHARQLSDLKKESEAIAAAKVKDTRTDAENLAAHSAAEQEALNNPA